MLTSINRYELEGLIAGGAQLVEVLPEDEYLEEHLQGAINLPLRPPHCRQRRSPRPGPPGGRVLLGRALRHEPTRARMADSHVNVLLVSTPEGKLLGAVRGPR